MLTQTPQLSNLSLVISFFTILGFLNSSSLSIAPENANGRPRAIVHIGPHKTGSSHVQFYFASHAAEVAQQGFYWPQKVDSKGKLSDKFFNLKDSDLTFAAELRRSAQSLELEQFLNTSAKANHNIVISAEDMSHLDDIAVKYLSHCLSAFEVTIIYTYRELLSRLMSSYEFEEDLKNLDATFEQSTLKGRKYSMFKSDMFSQLERYGSFFGIENIVVLDYHGMLAAGVDEVYVITCEIIGVMCHDASLSSSHVHHENSSPNFVPRQVNHILYSDAVAAGCTPTIPEKPDHKHIAAVEKELKQLENSSSRVPPLKALSEEEYVEPARLLDAQFRQQFSSVIRYGNVTANARAREEVAKASDVDEGAMRADPFWQDWMQNMQGNLLGLKC